VARTTCCPGPEDKSKGDSGLLRFAHGHKYPCHPGTYVTMHPKWAMLLFLQQINKHLITADLPRPSMGVGFIRFVLDRLPLPAKDVKFRTKASENQFRDTGTRSGFSSTGRLAVHNQPHSVRLDSKGRNPLAGRHYCGD
jgi:hypothetical protein